jgi:hypothetical protein
MGFHAKNAVHGLLSISPGKRRRHAVLSLELAQ